MTKSKFEKQHMTFDELRALELKKNGGKAAATEHDLQVGCVNVFRLLYPQFRNLLMAIPNGGFRAITTARMLIAEGVIKGVPDMFLAVASKGYHGLWIEMKNGKAGYVREEQKEMMALLSSQGYKCVVCRTLDDFISILKDYLE